MLSDVVRDFGLRWLMGSCWCVYAMSEGFPWVLADLVEKSDSRLCLIYDGVSLSDIFANNTWCFLINGALGCVDGYKLHSTQSFLSWRCCLFCLNPYCSIDDYRIIPLHRFPTDGIYYGLAVLREVIEWSLAAVLWGRNVNLRISKGIESHIIVTIPLFKLQKNASKNCWLGKWTYEAYSGYRMEWI